MESYFLEYEHTTEVIISLLIASIPLYLQYKKPKHKLVAKMDINNSDQANERKKEAKKQGTIYNPENREKHVNIVIENETSKKATILNSHKVSFLFGDNHYYQHYGYLEHSEKTIDAFSERNITVIKSLESYLNELAKEKVNKFLIYFMKFYIFTSNGQKIKVKLSEELRTKIKEQLVKK